MKTPKLLLAGAALCGLTAIPAFAQGNAFTYQGRLNDGPNPASGLYDLRFGIWNSPDAGNSTQLGLVTNSATRVTNGLFTVTLDFGTVWTGGDRWLEIAARTNGAVSFNTLGLRQFVTPTPYAIYAGSASAGGLRGAIGGGQIASGAIGPVHLSNSVSLWNRSGNNIHYTNGNVGIGTANPRRSIEIGDAAVGGSEGLIRLSSASGVGAHRTWDIGVPQTGEDLTGAGYSFVIDDLFRGSGPEFIVRWDSGHVGIGVTHPGARLHVAGSGFFGKDGGPLDFSAGSGIRVFQDDITLKGNIFAYDYAASASRDLILQEPGGSVGIGTSTPATKLEVAGTVTATSYLGDGSGLTGLSASQLTTGTVPAAVLGNAWTISGNVGTTPGAQFLGTTDNQPLEFKVNGERALRLQPSAGSPSVIGGWSLNTIDSGIRGAIIAGGGDDPSRNEIINNAHASAIGGGRGNVVSGRWGVIGGGDRNSAAGEAAVVGGGQLNSAAGPASAIPGGANNVTAGGAAYAFAAGRRARANHPGSFVWADSTDADFASSAARQFSVRAQGGVRFETAGAGLTVDGFVGIGTATPARPLTVHSSSPGYGIEHTDGSVRIGTYVQADAAYFGTISPHPLKFMVNDGTGSLIVNTNGNVGIGTATPSTRLDVAGDVTCVAVNITSDRNAKELFKPVNAREVLDKVSRLPISEWQYKTQADARHIGPMAQDFREAFALGRDEKHITSVDADGVALAAIQGLNEKLEEQIRDKDRRILELERNMAELKALLQRVPVAGQEGVAK